MASSAPKAKLVFIGYREQWEIDRMKAKAPANVEIVGVPVDAPWDRLIAEVTGATVLIPWRFDRAKLTSELLPRAKNLKLIQALSAGVDYLPVRDLAEMGIKVANNRGANAVAVAETAVLLTVAAYRHLARQFRQLETGKYAQNFFETWEQYHELTGKRVGIIGLGQIGSRVAKRLAGWECEIVYHDIVKIAPEKERECNAKSVGLDELLRTSDVVTLHVPLTAQTRGMISDRQFGLMKPSAVLVNTCRGPVVDEAALIRALKAKKIAGAGIDVTEVEPIAQDNPLIKMDNVFMLPHLAGLSIEAREKALDFAVHNAGRVASGLEPESVVPPSFSA
ncbi:MAG: lactate dehydrogenase [Dehalococcoidia bacterium]|nr:lactate dehydrogenase [Dehalococcoidia bacterium]